MFAKCSRANHLAVFRDSGLEVNRYRYYDKNIIGLDLNGMLEDIKAYATMSLSYYSPPHPAQLSCFTLVLTTQLELIQHKSNGRRFQMRVNREIILSFLTWHICRLHLAIRTKMRGRFDILSTRDIQLHWPNHLPKILGFMVNGSVRFLLCADHPRRSAVLNLN